MKYSFKFILFSYLTTILVYAKYIDGRTPTNTYQINENPINRNENIRIVYNENGQIQEIDASVGGVPTTTTTTTSKPKKVEKEEENDDRYSSTRPPPPYVYRNNIIYDEAAYGPEPVDPAILTNIHYDCIYKVQVNDNRPLQNNYNHRHHRHHHHKDVSILQDILNTSNFTLYKNTSTCRNAAQFIRRESLRVWMLKFSFQRHIQYEHKFNVCLFKFNANFTRTPIKDEKLIRRFNETIERYQSYLFPEDYSALVVNGGDIYGNSSIINFADDVDETLAEIVQQEQLEQQTFFKNKCWLSFYITDDNRNLNVNVNLPKLNDEREIAKRYEHECLMREALDEYLLPTEILNDDEDSKLLFDITIVNIIKYAWLHRTNCTIDRKCTFNVEAANNPKLFDEIGFCSSKYLFTTAAYAVYIDKSKRRRNYDDDIL